jgi:Kef-type K+ transport system membrane component KefB
MSSTAVVLKFLMEKNSTNSLHGQVTIGILILQDCAVGLLFALLPVLEGNSGIVHGMLSIGKVYGKTGRLFAPKAYSEDLMLIMLLLSFI